MAWEVAFLLFLQNHVRNDFLTPIMQFFSLTTNYGVFWILLCIVLLIFKKTRPIGIIAAISLVISFGLCNGVVKLLADRTRPFVAIEGLELITKRPPDSSFPSGHTSASFVVACAVTWCLSKKGKWIGLILIFTATLIAFSRLYLGAHYPTDVIAGILFGIGSSIVTYILLKDKVLHKDINNV